MFCCAFLSPQGVLECFPSSFCSSSVAAGGAGTHKVPAGLHVGTAAVEPEVARWGERDLASDNRMSSSMFFLRPVGTFVGHVSAIYLLLCLENGFYALCANYPMRAPARPVMLVVYVG